MAIPENDSQNNTQPRALLSDFFKSPPLAIPYAAEEKAAIQSFRKYYCDIVVGNVLAPTIYEIAQDMLARGMHGDRTGIGYPIQEEDRKKLETIGDSNAKQEYSKLLAAKCNAQADAAQLILKICSLRKMYATQMVSNVKDIDRFFNVENSQQPSSSHASPASGPGQ